MNLFRFYWFGHVNPLKHPCRTAARGRHNWADAYQERSLKIGSLVELGGKVVRNYVLCLFLLPPDGESEESGK